VTHSSVAAIRVDCVNKRFGDLTALNGISIEVNQGEFFGLLGPNGAGKSTLINILSGLLRAESGRVSVLGHDVQADYRQARQLLGVVPQEVVIDPFFTVREALEFQSGYFGIRNNDEWIDELLLQLGLADKADANMRRLSGGMKRRVLITAGVDVELRQSMWRFIRRLHNEGTTIILTTHYLEEAEELCDRIAIIDKGQVIALETKEDLLARGLGSKLLVRAAHDIGELPKQYAERVARLEGNELELVLNRDTDSMMDILDDLRAASIEITYVSVLSDSLEDVFVRMTGEDS